MSKNDPASFLNETYGKVKNIIPQKQPSRIDKPNWEYDYGVLSKNLIEHEPIKQLFNELFQLLNKELHNSIDYNKNIISTKNIVKKMDEILNHKLLQEYIKTGNLTKKEANKLFTLFIDKVLTNFVKLKSEDPNKYPNNFIKLKTPNKYPREHIEKITNCLDKLNDIWKMKIARKFETLDTNK